MKRPSARRPYRKLSPAEVQRSLYEVTARNAEARSTARASLDEAIVRHVAAHPRCYCVEVAAAVGAEVSVVRGRMIILERDGVLRSEKVWSPVSGNGRRLYSVAGTRRTAAP